MAVFLVAAPSRIECGMGEVIEVPGTSEAELRASLLEQVTLLCNPLTPVQDDEVTVAEMAARWERSSSTTQTILDRQVEAGALARRKALNRETGRECWAYRVCAEC